MKEKKENKIQANCDDCLYFDIDDETGMAECQINLDQDEMEQYLASKHDFCPYFRFYDEYKSVHKQI